HLHLASCRDVSGCGNRDRRARLQPSRGRPARCPRSAAAACTALVWRSDKESPAVSEPLLVVSDLHVEFPSEGGTVRALSGVDFEVTPEETIAVVGASGSG